MSEAQVGEVKDIFGDGGVLKEILIQGSGANVPRGVNCCVEYVGRFLDGTEFDSSVGRGEPFRFTIGEGNVIKAWDQGVKTMKRGERSIFTCRNDYAYGPLGSPPNIPPGATLVFEIHLIDWEPEDLSPKHDKGILRHPIEEGTGFDKPKTGAEVDVSLVGEYENIEFFNERLQFCLGEGSLKNVPKGIEKAIKKMIKGEKSKIELKPEYAFGSTGHEEFKIPPNVTVYYTVTLHSYEIIKDTWMMNSTEKLQHGQMLKEKGTSYYKEEKYALALKMWRKQSALLENASGFEAQEDDERKSLLLLSYLNAAMALLRSNDYATANEVCSKALEMDSKNVKALFRRGQALLNLNEPVLARNDFRKVLEIEPSNKAAVNQLTYCQKKFDAMKAIEKQLYASMFDKRSKKEDWRFGWWDGKPIVDVDENDSAIEEEILNEKKRELEAKRRFLERKAKEKEEREKMSEDKGLQQTTNDQEIKEDNQEASSTENLNPESQENEKQTSSDEAFLNAT